MGQIKLTPEVDEIYEVNPEWEAKSFDISGIQDGKIDLETITLFDVKRLKEWKRNNDDQPRDFLPMLVEKKKDLAE
ncbi:hypothetical protein VB796_08725 [Arcicella sp. LKC2W]|uniref:hypothetical protein n=1 Tax=Arcicella sp. LKC2W TaxID=2984198 RepID=UPI002B204908|nr:hypothetical protein [Arcicella sp. LKC2W]MEA5459118.1 hypothetical protein [Arcicella sp. LKC2W]